LIEHIARSVENKADVVIAYDLPLSLIPLRRRDEQGRLHVGGQFGVAVRSLLPGSLREARIPFAHDRWLRILDILQLTGTPGPEEAEYGSREDLQLPG
jgi:hypothetical protein